MSRFPRVLVGAVVALGLAANLLSLAQPVEAAPRPQSPRVLTPTAAPDGAGTKPAYGYQYRNLSKAKRADARAAVKISRNAVSKRGQTLDCKKANKYDGGRTTVRRQVAAAYLWAGKKITHISKAELKRLRKYVPRKKRPSRFDVRTPLEVPGILLDANPACSGRSGWKTVYDTYGARRGWTVYLNKCETANLKAGMVSVAFVTGVVAISTGNPPTSAALGTVAAIAGLGAGVIDILQDYSVSSSISITVISSPIGLIMTARPQ